MNIRERMEAFWSGERPDQIPYTIYDWEWRHTADDPAWQPLFAEGLGVTFHIPTVRETRNGVEDTTETWMEAGREHSCRTLRTPVGAIFETFIDGWRTKFLLETAEDYAVMTDVVRRTHIEPDYAPYLNQAATLPDYGVAMVNMHRTPLQVILVDFVGAGQFPYHLYDFQAEVAELYAALLVNFRRTVELVAAGPGHYVAVLENFTAEMLGPARYRDLLLPVYNELFPTLRGAGKIVGTHYDGRLASCRSLIAGAPIDLIESLTPPPEGDMTLAEARAAWPDKLFWSNLNIGCYGLPPEALRQLVLERVAQGAPDGRRLAFEVSEQFPANWRESMLTVLQALRETRA